VETSIVNMINKTLKSHAPHNLHFLDHLKHVHIIYSKVYQYIAGSTFFNFLHSPSLA